MVSHPPLRLALAAALCVMLRTVLSVAASDLTLSGPTNAMGDGVTPIQLQIVAPDTQSNLGLIVVSSGGQDAPIVGQGPGQFALQIVPPRIAVQTDLVVSVRKRSGGASAKHVIRLKVPAFESGEARGNGALRLRAPKRILLGSSGTSAISAVAPGRDVSFYASAGSLSAITREPGGRFRVNYSPPAERFPQRVIIAVATKERDLIDYTTIDLVASPDVRVKSVPDALVRVKLDNTVFGPFRTDRRGRALVAVHAGPGIFNATVVARDTAGFERSSLVPLNPPPFKKSLVICPEESDLATLIQPGAKAPPDARSVPGQLGPTKRIRPGIWTRELKYTSQVRAGTRASLNWGEAKCEYDVPGETPFSLALSLGEQTHVATSGQPVAIRIALKYRGDRAARRVHLDFEPDLGRITNVKQQSTDAVTAQWRLPKRLHGRRTAALVASVRGLADSKQRVELQLRPGPITRLVLTPAAPERRSATRRITVRAVAYDAEENAIENAKLEGTGAGTFSAFQQTGSGYTAIYTAAPSSDVLTVTEKDSGVSARLALPAEERTSSGRFNALVSGGYVTNFGKIQAPAGFVALGLRPGWLEDRLLLGVGVGFYRSEANGPDAANLEEVSIVAQAVPVVARATVELARGTVIPELGAEAGIVVSQSEIQSGSTGKSVSGNIVPAVGAVAGLATPLPVGRAGLMLRYTFARVDADAVSGNLGGMGAMLSYALDL